MPTAARSIFAAAAAVLLVAIIALGIRSASNETIPIAAPSATVETAEAIPVDPTTGATVEASDPPAEAEPTPSEPAATEPAAEATGGDAEPTEIPSEPDDDGDATGEGASAGSDTGDSGTERTVDDMPNTGGGAVTSLAGLVVILAGSGLARRR